MPAGHMVSDNFAAGHAELASDCDYAPKRRNDGELDAFVAIAPHRRVRQISRLSAGLKPLP